MVDHWATQKHSGTHPANKEIKKMLKINEIKIENIFYSNNENIFNEIEKFYVNNNKFLKN